jgi:sarcosine oxidase subunit beta
MNADVIVIGAGSVGTPLAMYLAEAGVRTLVLDSGASAGQGNNKCAIGGIRATHGDPAKVALCLDSIAVFRTWQEEHGESIGWHQGGYSFVAYTREIADSLRGMIPSQRQAGLDIDWHEPAFIRELIPGINPEGLLGGTFSPGDGSASPMKSCYAFHDRAAGLGARFLFRESVTGIDNRAGVFTVRTNRGSHQSGALVNCAGSNAREIGHMIGIDLPVVPDSHEAGITEPVGRFFHPMVVDLRRVPGSSNYYFYQYDSGQVVFCVSPDPLISGTDTRETSVFLPQVASRMVSLWPRLANLKVRRTWRGCYPQTPDGSPILGQVGPDGSYAAVGMCGQGFMLGPGAGSALARLITGRPTETDLMVMESMRVDREFGSTEALK